MAFKILEEYGVEEHERGEPRVRLGILKISKNNIESLRKNTRYAKQDYRDVLCWAEYPNQSKNWPKPNSPKKQELIDKDERQYKEWLYGD
ncbi:MAG: hypothetical protein FVQ83_02895 [Chloroflexi bacterium]|nr:hypothetical protein [Chloroflexota bacterium]